MNETFGQRIQRLRKQKGLTQEDVAKRITISPQAVSKQENDASSPDITMIGDLADILGVSVDELLGREEKKQASEESKDDEVEAESADRVEVEKDEFIKKEDKDRVVINNHGVHITSEDGEEVHIDGSGIHTISKDGEEVKVESFPPEKESWITGGMLMGVALIAYILVGVFWKEHNMGWVFGWTFFLDAIWLSTILPAIKHRRVTDFAYPFLVTSAYCKLGFLGVEYGFEGWGTYWFLFLTIPAFYMILGPIQHYFKHRNGESYRE